MQKNIHFHQFIQKCQKDVRDPLLYIWGDLLFRHIFRYSIVRIAVRFVKTEKGAGIFFSR